MSCISMAGRYQTFLSAARWRVSFVYRDVEEKYLRAKRLAKAYWGLVHVLKYDTCSGVLVMPLDNGFEIEIGDVVRVRFGDVVVELPDERLLIRMKICVGEVCLQSRARS
ncbi:MAG: hypothetical protein ACK4SY_07140 [Pyrobaculum sp.]